MRYYFNNSRRRNFRFLVVSDKFDFQFFGTLLLLLPRTVLDGARKQNIYIDTLNDIFIEFGTVCFSFFYLRNLKNKIDAFQRRYNQRPLIEIKDGPLISLEQLNIAIAFNSNNQYIDFFLGKAQKLNMLIMQNIKNSGNEPDAFPVLFNFTQFENRFNLFHK